MKNYLVLLLAMFANMFHKFKDSFGTSLSSNTTKGGINRKHLEYMKKDDVKYKHSYRKRSRYSGIRKYTKVPAIQ